MGRFVRRVASTAPANAPSASAVDSRPYPLAPRWKTCLAISAQVIWKFRPNVPMTKISTIVSIRSGRPRTYRKPSRSWPFARRTGADGCSSAGRINASPASTATLDSALARKAQPVPTAVIVMPAMAGPMMRAELNVVELMATALASSSLPTISTTNDCRTGMSTALIRPRTNGEQQHLPVGDDAGDVEQAEQQRDQRQAGLGGEQQLALVEPVGEHAAPQPEQDRRARTAGP